MIYPPAPTVSLPQTSSSRPPRPTASPPPTSAFDLTLPPFFDKIAHSHSNKTIGTQRVKGVS